jgi:acetyltransferase-like isoleucine patch superfamily enzyme
MDKDLAKLHRALVELQKQLRSESKQKYNRINPFAEDLFDWKERGEFWSGSGKDITIYNTTTVIGDVKIGDHTWIGPFCALDGSGGLIIGKYCSISSSVQIVTHDTVKWALSGGSLDRELAPIVIGSYCFIGSQAVVKKGVSIGDHCLIAAGSVVVRDVDSFSIVAGTPAQLIGHVVIHPEGGITLKYNNEKSKN